MIANLICDTCGMDAPLFIDWQSIARSEGWLPPEEVAELRRDAERYRAALDQVKHLTNIVRMPNAEYVADEHNAAVNALREIRDAIRSGK